MIIPTMKSCSKPPSMRPISRLTDCQVGWLWTVETAVKITPLPLILCSLQETNFVAVQLRLWVLRVCVVAVFALCVFSSLSTFQTDSRVGNMLCDQWNSQNCGWTAHVSTVLRCLVRERQAACCRCEPHLQDIYTINKPDPTGWRKQAVARDSVCSD